MSFRFRRSIKLLPGIRKTSGLPGAGLSYTHMEETRAVGFGAPAANVLLDCSAPPRRDWRGLLWIGLIVFAIAAAAARQ
jgi:hypothetical protein